MTFSIADELNGGTFDLLLSDKIDKVKDTWDSFSDNNIYASSEYLSLLESHGPISYQYIYAILKKEGNPVAAIYFQLKRIQLSKDFRVHSHSDSAFDKFKVFVQKNLFKLVNHNLLICGNVLLTGEYAFGLAPKYTLSPMVFDKIFSQVCLYSKMHFSKKVNTILAKDFYKDKPFKKQTFNVDGFIPTIVQPAMIMAIDDQWESFNDYLSIVKSKYRVKFKKVLKKSKGLEFRILDEAGVLEFNDKMYSLYKETADRATFSLFTLSPNYFYELKKVMGDSLRIFAVLENEQLLGFFTFVKDGDHADAHFLGYDVKLNSKYQLYFNMLLKLVENAIETKSKYLNLSRTALEIKSSIGAEAQEMFIYLRYNNKLINKLLPTILSYMVPKTEWQPRSPFK